MRWMNAKIIDVENRQSVISGVNYKALTLELDDGTLVYDNVITDKSHKGYWRYARYREVVDKRRVSVKVGKKCGYRGTVGVGDVGPPLPSTPVSDTLIEVGGALVKFGRCLKQKGIA